MVKIISLIIIIIYLIATYIYLGGESFLYMMGYLLLPFICIWFSEEMGAFTGKRFLDVITSGRTITSKSPAGLVKLFGWFLLLLPLLLIILLPHIT